MLQQGRPSRGEISWENYIVLVCVPASATHLGNSFYHPLTTSQRSFTSHLNAPISMKRHITFCASSGKLIIKEFQTHTRFKPYRTAMIASLFWHSVKTYVWRKTELLPFLFLTVLLFSPETKFIMTSQPTITNITEFFFRFNKLSTTCTTGTIDIADSSQRLLKASNFLS